MRTNYKQKLFLYFVVIFAIFAVGITLLEQKHERDYKTEALEDKLNDYANIVNRMLQEHPNELSSIDSLLKLFPPNIRLTLIDRQGNVFYDNEILYNKILLTKTEFEIIVLLSENKDRIFSRNEIIDRVWKETPYITERTVDVHITRLRKKLGNKSSIISNRPGFGYRFNPSD